MKNLDKNDIKFIKYVLEIQMDNCRNTIADFYEDKTLRLVHEGHLKRLKKVYKKL